MSSRSRNAGEPQARRTPAEARAAVARHVRLLRVLGDVFDDGNEDAAYPLSVSLRVLIHDRALGQVVNLDKVRFIDTADPWGLEQGGRLGLGAGLTRMRFTAGHPESGEVVPPLGEGGQSGRTAPFRDWWSRDLVVPGWALDRDFTRQYVVTEMVNTDGAHVDRSRDTAYVGLHGDDVKFRYESRPFTGSVAAVSVRQIAWEVAETVAGLELAP